MRTCRVALVFALAALAGGCDRSHETGDGGTGGACVDGAHRCQGNVGRTPCPSDQGCSDTLGCVPCTPGKGGCDGDHIVRCGDDGQPTKDFIGDCKPSTCVIANGAAVCAGPRDPKVLAKTYTGCVYY